MFRDRRPDSVDEAELQLLPTPSPVPERRRDGRWKERANGPLAHRVLRSLVLAVVVVLLVLLPSPLSGSGRYSAFDDADAVNSTTPRNVTYETFFPPPTPSLLQGALEQSTWKNIELASSIFVPFSVRECSITTPSWFAPCVARRTGVQSMYGEELLYPDFGLAIPVFAKEDHRNLWLEAAKKVGRMQYEKRGQEEYMLYAGQHGQNYVLQNISFAPPRMDSWASTSCGIEDTSLRDLAIEPLPSGSLPNTSALLVSTPDSWSFQHFLDRATHVVGQGRHLLLSSNNTVALTGRAGSATVREMWARLGFEDDRVLHHPTKRMELSKLVFACKSVLIHPYLSWKSAEMMGLPWARGWQYPVDSSSKKVVMYMSRSDGRAGNGGRRVLNEPDVLSAITSLLESRNKGERLEMFDPTKYPDVSSLINTFSRDVAAVVGPHGGSLMNHRFAGPDTLVLEFLPTTRMEVINFEETSMLNQTYAAIVTPGIGRQHDMKVEVDDVVKVLGQTLGMPGRPVLMPYQWVKE